MGINITSLTGNGLKDWLIQRVTAVYIAIYVAIVAGYFLTHHNINYIEWHAIMHNQFVQIATILALLMISLHAWIGLWTVTTDYIKCTALRLSLQVAIAIFLLGQFVLGFIIFWGQS